MEIKTICCECGAMIHDGPQPENECSHGFCRRCQAVIMAFISGGDYDREHASKMQTVDF